MDQLIQNQSKQPLAAPTVSYTQSLRAIGQALEALRLRSFELRKNATDYMLRVRISASAGKVKTISAKTLRGRRTFQETSFGCRDCHNKRCYGALRC
jgi:hypothetical protein